MQLNEDIAQVWHLKIASMEFDSHNPFELANKELWCGIGREGALEKAIVASKKFWEAREKFYDARGQQSEWGLWKRFLKGLDEFLVEDSNGKFGKEESEVRAEMKPGVGSIGIPELDELEYDDEKPKKSMAT